MASMQEQARALGDPTRHSLFRYVAASNEPVSVAELTDHFELNHNAIRQHLAKLTAADLVIEAKAPTRGPGRPKLVYSVDPTADSRWGVEGPYERLSLLLAEIIRSGETPREVGRRTGREMREDDEEDLVTAVCTAMAKQGFDPEVRQRADGADVVLRSCPFESSAIADPDTVCQLHLGMAEGLIDDDDTIVVEDLIPKAPRRANCRLELRAGRTTG